MGLVEIRCVSSQRNGDRPGAIHWVPILASLIPVAILAALDARRHPRAAAVGYAAALFAIFGWLLAHAPAFAPNVPGAGVTLVAIALTLLAALGGAEGGTRLGRALER